MNSPNELLNQAIQHHQARDFAQAIALYEQILQQNPNFAEVHNNLATIYHRQQQFSQALEHYAQAIQLQPDYLEAHINLGMLFLRQNNQEAAIKQFNNVIQLYPESIIGNLQLGNLLLAHDQAQEATNHFSIVLKQQPQHIEALNNMGAALLRQNKLVEASEYFNKALEIEPKHQDTRSNLAAALLQQDKFREAIWHYQLFLRSMPNDIEAHYNLGVAYMSSGNLQDALLQFEEVIKLKPDYIDAYCNLGAIYLKLGNKNNAIKYYQQAYQLKPSDPAIYYRLVSLTGEETPTTAPGEYVKNLFDNYAGYFEQHLKEKLQYQIPMLIKNVINKSSLASLFQRGGFLNILDLGCGTGLMGEEITTATSLPRNDMLKLTGIDISPRMLAKAREKNIYAQLIEGNILQVLKELTDNYDLIVAADTLVYFGDLSAIFNNCYRLLKQNSLLIFSTELGNTETYQLQSTGRYTHSKSYIEKLAQENNFALLECQEVIGRQQQSENVESAIFVLQK